MQVLRLGYPALEKARGSPPSLRMTAFGYCSKISNKKRDYVDDCYECCFGCEEFRIG